MSLKHWTLALACFMALAFCHEARTAEQPLPLGQKEKVEPPKPGETEFFDEIGVGTPALTDDGEARVLPLGKKKIKVEEKEN